MKIIGDDRLHVLFNKHILKLLRKYTMKVCEKCLVVLLQHVAGDDQMLHLRST